MNRIEIHLDERTYLVLVDFTFRAFHVFVLKKLTWSDA